MQQRFFEGIPLFLAEVQPKAGDGNGGAGDGGGGNGGNGSGGQVELGGDGKVKTPTPPKKDDPPGLFGDTTTLFLMGGALLLIVFMMFNGRKQKKQRQQMLAAIKRGDRVQTVGGVIGSVLEVRENEIVLKVDEGSNTKMRFARSAIQGVVGERGGGGGDDDKKNDKD